VRPGGSKEKDLKERVGTERETEGDGSSVGWKEKVEENPTAVGGEETRERTKKKRG
jgi:hypothetical protein